MNVLTEIPKTRDEMARVAGYDVKKFMDAIRERERTAAAKGFAFADPIVVGEESCILREDPPKV